jgi:hypothetical protein
MVGGMVVLSLHSLASYGRTYASLRFSSAGCNMSFICLHRVTRYRTTIQQYTISAWFLERSIQIISHYCVGILFIKSSNYHARVIFLSNGQSQKQHTAKTSRSQLHGTLDYVYLQEFIEKAGSSSTCGTPALFPSATST